MPLGVAGTAESKVWLGHSLFTLLLLSDMGAVVGFQSYRQCCTKHLEVCFVWTRGLSRVSSYATDGHGHVNRTHGQFCNVVTQIHAPPVVMPAPLAVHPGYIFYYRNSPILQIGHGDRKKTG